MSALLAAASHGGASDTWKFLGVLLLAVVTLAVLTGGKNDGR